MKVLDYIKSLLPNFSKQNVLEDIRITRLVIATVAIPTYEKAMPIFANRRMVNPGLQSHWETFRRNVKGAQGNNVLAVIDKSFKNMLSTLDMMEKLIEKSYDDEIAGRGLTYYKAAVLQMIESITFAGDYALRYLNYVLVLEASELKKDADEAGVDIDDLSEVIDPADIRYITDRFIDFCTVMATLIKPAEKVREEIETVPDIIVDEKTDAIMSSTQGQAKVDPFKHGLIPLSFNIIYHVRMRFAEWQHARYEAAKVEKDALELRILRMKKLLDSGSAPAGLEQQIQYTEKRLAELKLDLKKVEEQYA